jgi:hypothetical protein
MKCWKTAFSAQGSRLIIVVVQIRAVEIYVAVLEALRKTGMKLNLPPKTLVGKLVWVSVISFLKISFPGKHLMPYYVETGHSRPLIAWLYG